MPQDKIPYSVLKPFQVGAPVDIRGMAEALGLKIWESKHLPPSISGKLFFDQEHGGTAHYSIQVNAADSYVRKRFTVAHEIAHFILHKDLIGTGLADNEFYRSGLPENEEFEANRLAADILMPLHLIFRYREMGFTDTKALARKFQVSEGAMRIQLDSLLTATPEANR